MTCILNNRYLGNICTFNIKPGSSVLSYKCLCSLMSSKEGKERFHMCPTDKLMMLMLMSRLQQVYMCLSLFFFFLLFVLFNHWFLSSTTGKGYSFVLGRLRLGLAKLVSGQGFSITTKKSGKCQV